MQKSVKRTISLSSFFKVNTPNTSVGRTSIWTGNYSRLESDDQIRQHTPLTQKVGKEREDLITQKILAISATQAKRTETAHCRFVDLEKSVCSLQEQGALLHSPSRKDMLKETGKALIWM